MKCSESWLRQWVNPSLAREALCDRLTMAGLEVEECVPVALPFSKVIVGRIITVKQHPDAERLHVCEVDVGQSAPLTIVCAAENVAPKLVTAVAMIGASLPHEKSVSAATLRGVASEGMLCSASDLNLAEESSGILVLPNDAPLGQDVWQYLQLDDHIIDVSITPNRGDCLSIKGLAREIAALTDAPLTPPRIAPIPATVRDTLPITLTASDDCPIYLGRVIRNIRKDAQTPIWLKERLRRAGIRSISPVVDVTNYVMLELGQPMHAFDYDKIQQQIVVRLSQAGEKIVLLDDSEQVLDDATLVIADAAQPLAIAGVMGGVASSVTPDTQHIFLESAYFTVAATARSRQHYQLNSDSAYRFERGVDPTLQRDAMERASALILEIAGGEAGPIIEVNHAASLPRTSEISLSQEKITQVIGVAIPVAEIQKIFAALQLPAQLLATPEPHWKVSIPAYRFDLRLPEDLIEEIARLYGYDRIPTHPLHADLQVSSGVETTLDTYALRHALSQLGYHEIISYSFVEEKLQQLFDPHHQPYPLVNPITADMTVMRTSLWPGLINTLLYNKARQQHELRLFEIGTCFITTAGHLTQPTHLAGISCGLAAPEQWGNPRREVDFYDMKGELEKLLKQFQLHHAITYKPAKHPGLHPGQSADIFQNDQKIGVFGLIHPSVAQVLEVNSKIFLFEFDLTQLQNTRQLHLTEISKFPEIRRDLALLVNRAIPAQEIQATIRMVAGDWLKDSFIFDVYQGKGISPDQKSVALALIVQHPTRTLVDDEITELVDRVISALKGKLGAELRS